MLDRQLGLTAISDDLPAGSNPREGETYAMLEAEIAKMVDLNAQGAVDWRRVAQLAEKVLRHEGKDLNAAVWLAVGWTHCEGADGLAAGVRVLRDLVDAYWDVMTPSVARLRGRRNQIEWLVQQLEKVLVAADAGWMTLDAASHAALLADWNRIDERWQEHDDQAPDMFKLHRRLGDLAPVVDEGPSGETAAEPGVCGQTMPASDVLPQNAQASAGSVEQDRGAEPEAGRSPVTETHNAPRSAGALSKHAGTTEKPMGGVEQEAEAPQSETALIRLVDERLGALQQMLMDVSADLVSLPLLYRLNRMCAWLTLDTAPPDQDGVTRVPAPSSSDQDMLEQFRQRDDPRALLRFAESRLSTQRFWLDLNRIAHDAARALPDGTPIAETVAMETAGLLRRMPGLVGLAFSNEQPFADADTRAWLQSLSGNADISAPASTLAPAHAPAGAPAAGSPAMATLCAVAGAETEAAMRLLEVVLTRLRSGSDGLARS